MKDRLRKRILGSLDVTHSYAGALKREFVRSTPKNFTLILCSNCELIYLSPLPEKTVFNEIYINNKQFNCDVYRGARAKSAIEFYTDRFNVLLQEIDTADKNINIRVLEIGAGLSWLCRAAKNYNEKCITVAQDISSEAIETCKWVDSYVVGEMDLN